MEFDIIGSNALIYTLFEAAVALVAFLGNLLVILVFLLDKRLRKVTNFYIISLSFADLLVGAIGIPSAILTHEGLPRNSTALCIIMLCILITLCTISILNLVAVSLDRYWAILHPLDYHKRISRKTALCIICACWILGTAIGLLPLFAWIAVRDETNADSSFISRVATFFIHEDTFLMKFRENQKCFFTKIISYSYLRLLYFATIITPGLILAFFYLRIYIVVVQQLSLHKIRHMNSDDLIQSKSNTSSQSLTSAGDSSSTISKMTAHRSPRPMSYSRREVKKAQQLFVIVIFFMLCWLPLYTVNTITSYCAKCAIPSSWLDSLIILSHLNSAGSPFLYAFHLKDFRGSLRRLISKGGVNKRQLRDLRREEMLSISGRFRGLGLSVNNGHISPEIHSFSDAPYYSSSSMSYRAKQRTGSSLKTSHKYLKCTARNPALENLREVTSTASKEY